ncbi:hypothetical protein ACQ4PT_062516 [Festuca glaucescens]
MHGYTKLVFWMLLLSSSSPYFGHGRPPWPWVFPENGTGGYICDFIGVECWTPNENRVLSLRLGNLGLEGPFPEGLQLCSSMTSLDLSGNKLSGPLPESISGQLSYMTNLDLSNNSFSGGIPVSIANMTYLNTLALQHNQFDGRIPAQLSNLSRLVSFSVTDNSLSGPVPDSLQRFPSANFTGNPWLCGRRWTRSARRGSGCGYTFGLSGFG